MLFYAEIDIMPHRELLDPQGKAVLLSLRQQHHSEQTSIEEVRVGKHIKLAIQAPSAEAALTLAENACRDLLANLIMETYSIVIIAAEDVV